MQASAKLERSYCMGGDFTLLNMKDKETKISLSPVWVLILVAVTSLTGDLVASFAKGTQS